MFLPDFPSGSSINYHNNRLYLIGDDANNILVLDCEYKEQGTIRVFDFTDKRIPKPEKADYETSTIVNVAGKECLIVLGSASRKNRRKGILIELDNKQNVRQIDFEQFVKRIKEGVSEMNLEGCAALKDYFLLSSRANDKNPNNIFIVTSSDFWTRQEGTPISICDIVLPLKSEEVVGISELCYVKSKDLLLVSLSSEKTSDAYHDGAIGKSYIGWINSISAKIHQSKITLYAMHDLSEYNAAFIREKIEGVCVESVEDKTLHIHLVSDNDQGTTRLFRVRMIID